ncbi:MAG: hypothetical protein QM687_06330 [Ferruginibacter sp.]
MGMYFRCYGYLQFENETIAKQKFELLITAKDNRYHYSPGELEITGTNINFKTSGDFSSYSTCEKTCDLIYEVAENSYNGDVKIDEGDGENCLWSWRSYRVRAKTLYYEHTDPKKSFRFKGNLAFENEDGAKEACKLLTTDIKNSLFTKYPPNQIVFTDDKRAVYFKKNVLYIDVHCPGDVAWFNKTKRLIDKLKTNNGKVESEETVCLRYIPVIGHSSIDWVNDNKGHVFYQYSGSLSFKTRQEADTALSKLLHNPKVVFSNSSKKSFPLYVVTEKLYFDDRGNCCLSSLNDTEKLINDIAGTALRGKVEMAFSIFEKMDIYVVNRIVPSKIRASVKNSKKPGKEKNKS